MNKFGLTERNSEESKWCVVYTTPPGLDSDRLT